MAHIIADRVVETTTTTGTGALTLAGAVSGYRAFSSVCAVGDTAECYVEGVDAFGVPTGEWETSVSTYSAANTLTRTTIVASSNGGAAVNFSSGTKRVAISLLARSFQWTEIASATPSGVNTVDFTGIPAAQFASLKLVFGAISFATSSFPECSIQFSSDGSNWTSAQYIAFANDGTETILGNVYINEAYGPCVEVTPWTFTLDTNLASAGNPGFSLYSSVHRLDAGVSAVRITGSANFDAGTIKLFGK